VLASFFNVVQKIGIPHKGGAFEVVDESSRNMESTLEAMALAEGNTPESSVSTSKPVF
jgi:hypothetical protein